MVFDGFDTASIGFWQMSVGCGGSWCANRIDTLSMLVILKANDWKCGQHASRIDVKRDGTTCTPTNSACPGTRTRAGGNMMRRYMD